MDRYSVCSCDKNIKAVTDEVEKQRIQIVALQQMSMSLSMADPPVISNQTMALVVAGAPGIQRQGPSPGIPSPPFRPPDAPPGPFARATVAASMRPSPGPPWPKVTLDILSTEMAVGFQRFEECQEISISEMKQIQENQTQKAARHKSVQESLDAMQNQMAAQFTENKTAAQLTENKMAAQFVETRMAAQFTETRIEAMQNQMAAQFTENKTAAQFAETRIEAMQNQMAAQFAENKTAAQFAAAELAEMKSELVEMKSLIRKVLSHTAKIVMSNAVAEVSASRTENTNLSQSLPQNFKYTESVPGEGGGMR